VPSNKILEEKKQIVEDLKVRIKASAAGVFVDYQGITVEDDTKLRARMREAGVVYTVNKNSMYRLAIKDCGLEELDPIFEKMTALATSEGDPVAPAKILSEYADKIPTFRIKAGFLDGKPITDDKVVALAKLPSKEVLVATLLGALNSPITGLVNVLNGNIRGLACVLQAIADKKAEA